MARVQQAAIDRARESIGDLISSPAFPSRDVLLESNRTLYNLVTRIRADIRTIPEKTICRLLAEALDLGSDITDEALWKRFRRVSANRDGYDINRENGSVTVSPVDICDNSNRDKSDVNRDAPDRLFIPAGISQTDLAAGLAGFFESKRYTSASLLRTCLMAMDGMTARMGVLEIKNAIDAWYHPQDSRDDDGDTDETAP